MKKQILFVTGVLAIALLFSSCPDAVTPAETSVYSVTIGSLQNGSITASPTSGPAGTVIQIQVNPNSRYKYASGTLKYDSTPISDTGSQPYTFSLPAKNVTITANFEPLAANEYSVTIAPDSIGKITANPQYGLVGDTITLTVAAGYGIKDNTLSITHTPGGQTVTPTKSSATSATFTLPAADVTVSAQFESNSNKSTEQLLKDGTAALTEGNLDAAIDAFESAWQKDSTNPKAIVYSSLGKLASIATSENVRKLMADRFGISNYPGTIDKLISPDWLETYTDERLVDWYYEGGNYFYWYDAEDTWFFTYYGLTPKSGYYRWNNNSYVFVSSIPKYETSTTEFLGFSVPAWFKDTGAYKDTLTSKNLQSSGTYNMLMFANLLDKNTSGLNGLLDDVLSSVFGSGFDAAVNRAAGLTYSQTVEIDENIMEAFGLSEIFEGDQISIGKAELDLLFSAVRIFKAGVEWIAAYDWNTDLSFMKFDWNTIMDDLGSHKPATLPFRNNFMKDRNNGMMAKSKDDLIKAIDNSVAAYNHLIGTSSKYPQAAKDTLKEYEWLKDGFTQLKTAINNGTVFYITESSGSAYNNTATNALFGINMGKLFNPGQLAIDKLISATGSGNAQTPVFYGFNWNKSKDEYVATAITAKTAITDYEMIGFRVNLAPVKDIIVKGIEDAPATQDIPLFPPDIGEVLWDFYH